MNKSRVILLFNTVKFLKFSQLYSQVLYRLFSITSFLYFYKSFRIYNDKKYFDKNDLKIKNTSIKDIDITILNKIVNTKDIVCNQSGYGKLFSYNINYFDFINQEYISSGLALKIILRYINKKESCTIGNEPYPISLRNINLIKYCTNNSISNRIIDTSIFDDYKILLRKLEFHIQGNHLLENSFSIMFGAYYFNNEHLYKIAKQILISELNEEILEDGGHFELSPMYHSIILQRLLSLIDYIKTHRWKQDSLLSFLESKAEIMLGWFENVTFRNGNFPMVNDSAYGVAESYSVLMSYAKRLGIINKNIKLGKSGYRMLTNNNFELFIDVGKIGPDYIPGHAHADTFNFVLHVDTNPFFVDSGISTYDKNELRCTERSTLSHNTVIVNNNNSSNVWGGFRVAKRANVLLKKDEDSIVSASHDGYKQYEITHNRKFELSNSRILITDSITEGIKKPSLSTFAIFHLHESISIYNNSNAISLKCKNVTLLIKFEGDDSVEFGDFNLAKGYNKRINSKYIKVKFKKKLITKIEKINE